MNVERGVDLSVSCILDCRRLTYRSRSISFSRVNYIEPLSTDGRNDMSPLVRLVGIGVMSEVSTSSESLE